MSQHQSKLPQSTNSRNIKANTKRKSTASPDDKSPGIATLQKVAKGVNGKAQKPPPQLHHANQVPSQPQSTSNAPQQHPLQHPADRTSKVVKPVFVESNIQVVKNHVNNVSFATQPLLKIVSKQKIQVSCYNHADKLKLIESLNSKLLRHYTFSEASEKSTIFVLRGFYKATTDEMLKALQESDVKAEKVTFLSDNEESPIYIVHFKKGEVNFNDLSFNHKSIDNLIVKWEKLDQSRKRPTQCHRCQLWGHSARNCGREFRCVKCTEKHEPGSCSRTTREGNAKCVNCDGDHPANSRQCHAFLSYQERTTRRRAPRQFTSTPAPWANDNSNNRLQPSHFPALTNRHVQQNDNTSDQQEDVQHQSVSFTQPPTSRNSRNSRRAPTSSFANLQANFQSIPEIDVTMRLFGNLIQELSSTMNHAERLTIMLRYCSPSPAHNVP